MSDQMITSAEEFVALRTSDDQDRYLQAAHDTAPEAVWLDVITRFPDMREWVAHNKTVPLSILVILANDTDSRVRDMVAMKRKAGPVLLEKLARDPDGGARHSVACNRKTPVSVLHILAHDQETFIAETAKRRLSDGRS